MIITRVLFPQFETLIISGKVSLKDKLKIEEILNTMSSDDYAGYSPSEQKKCKQIKTILNKYQKVKILTIAQRWGL